MVMDSAHDYRDHGNPAVLCRILFIWPASSDQRKNGEYKRDENDQNQKRRLLNDPAQYL